MIKNHEVIILLQVIIPASEKYDESSNTFFKTKEQKLNLEHSLVSISKWESKWKKPFISRESKTIEETLDYIRCMTINPNVDPNVYLDIPQDVLKKIQDYIDDPMTATWINSKENGSNRQIITSELIYYWMVSYRIPIECQKWHLNRLLMLIRVCDEKNKAPKKMKKSDILSRNARLNAARRAKLHSKG